MIGTTLGHYRILETLGKGGMGDVYLAEDTKLQRRVALKVLPRELALDASRRERFQREARAVAALNHPNIVTIHSVEEIDGVPFLTLELVDGQTLGQIIKGKALPLERLLAIAIPLTDAVGAAHQKGITHRDLKPANVMLTNDGRLKVLDFGLAKLVEDAGGTADASLPTGELTGEGRILGTVAYMSPEQAEGKPIDQRSDVFSLGVILYEMAAGERPFKGDTQLSLLSAIIKDTPSSVSDLKADLPRDLGRILKRCLAKDPEDRYQTAKDLRNDLRLLKDDLASGEASAVSAVRAAAAPAAASPRVWQRPAVWVGAVALLAILAVAVAMRRGSGPAADSAATTPFAAVALSRLTTGGRAGMAALSADGKYVAHVVFDEGRQSLWLRQVATSSNVEIVPSAEVNYDGLGFSSSGDHVLYVSYPRGENYASLHQVPVLGGASRKLVEDIDSAPAFSPDGKRFAFLRGLPENAESAVMVASADGSDVKRLADSPPSTAILRSFREAFEESPRAQDSLPAGFHEPMLSPDGRLMAGHYLPKERRGERMALVPLDPKVEPTLFPDIPSNARWAPDGRSLIYVQTARGVSNVWRQPVPGGTPVQISKFTNDEIFNGDMSPDGARMAVVRGGVTSDVVLVSDRGVR